MWDVSLAFLELLRRWLSVGRHVDQVEEGSEMTTAMLTILRTTGCFLSGVLVACVC